MDKHACMLPRRPSRAAASPAAGLLRRRLRGLRRATLPCPWHYGTELYIRSRKSLATEQERQLASGSWLVWHPYSPMKTYWDFFYLTLSLAVFMYMPFQVFFVCPNPYDPFVLFGDLMAFADICTKFVTGYNEGGNENIVLRPEDIARKYLRGTLACDAVGALPLQIYRPRAACEFPTHTVMFVFKLARLFSLKETWGNVYQQLKLSYATTVAAEVLVGAILFFHWMTYIHYQVPAFFSHYLQRDVVWGQRLHMRLAKHEIFQKYTTNLYWVCGLCVGAGYYNPVYNYLIPDLLLNSAMGIVGLLFIIYSFTTLLRLFMYARHNKYQYSGRLKDLQEYIERKRLPKFLKKKIFLFLNYQFFGSYFNEEAIQSTINEQIKQDINVHFCKTLVSNIPTFQDMPVAFINSIIFSLTQVLYMPGETVVTSGEPVDCLYLISSGTVAVMNSIGKEITHLRDGAYFGEDALFDTTKMRTTTVVALEITQIYKLTTEAYRSCIRPYPQLDQRLRTASLNSGSHMRRRGPPLPE